MFPSHSSSFLFLATLIVTTCVEGFVVPAAFAVSKNGPIAKTSTTLSLLRQAAAAPFPNDFPTFHFLSHEPSLLLGGIESDVFQNGGGGIMDTITTVLTRIIGVVFFLVGLTFVMAAVIIPQAAQQLERQTKELDPELWAKYEAQLEPGQTMDQRPDLMQELGEKMQALMDAKFKEQQQAQSSNDDNESVRPQVMDAEIISKDTSNVGGVDDPWSG